MGGISGLSPANKAFGVLNAMGSMGFACESGVWGASCSALVAMKHAVDEAGWAVGGVVAPVAWLASRQPCA